MKTHKNIVYIFVEGASHVSSIYLHDLTKVIVIDREKFNTGHVTVDDLNGLTMGQIADVVQNIAHAFGEEVKNIE